MQSALMLFFKFNQTEVALYITDEGFALASVMLLPRTAPIVRQPKSNGSGN
jgi:hypothetical protein